MSNPQKGEVKLGEHTLHFNFDKLAGLMDELIILEMSGLFYACNNLKSLRRMIAVGAGIEEKDVNEMDMPIIKMTNPVIEALSWAIFGEKEPPAPDESDPQ